METKPWWVLKQEAFEKEVEDNLREGRAGLARGETSVYELKMSVRCANAMNRYGILTAQQLAAKTERQLLQIRNLGRLSVAQLRGALQAWGLDLTNEPESQRRRITELERQLQEARAQIEQLQSHP